MKLQCSAVALLVLLLTTCFLEAAMAGSVFCDTKCGQRCSKASRKKLCLFDCGVCCKDCHCVPSGTYGNMDECPCYRDKLTSDGTRHKCP